MNYSNENLGCFAIVQSFDLFEVLKIFYNMIQEFYPLIVVVFELRHQNPENRVQAHDHLKSLHCSARVNTMGILGQGCAMYSCDRR